MIDGVLVAGFKAFGVDWQYLPIRPITLIFGQNSAGKSSLLHLMAWMYEIHTTGQVNARKLRLCGDNVDLRGFDNFKNRVHDDFGSGPFEEGDTIGIGWGFKFQDPIKTPEYSPDHDGRGTNKGHAAWRLNYEIQRSGIYVVRIHVGHISMAWTLKGDQFEFDGFLGCADGQQGDCQDPQFILGDSARQYLASTIGNEGKQKKWTDDWCVKFSDKIRKELQGSSLRLNGLIPVLKLPQPNFFGEIPEATEFLRNLQAGLAQMKSDLTDFIGKFAYLGPWRKIPALEDLYSGGANLDENNEFQLWRAVRENEELRDELNNWVKRFGFDIEIVERDLIDRQELLRNILLAINEKKQIQSLPTINLAGLGMNKGEEDYATQSELESIIKNQATSEMGLQLRLVPSRVKIAPGDTGVGISQLVPVISAALSAKSRTWLVEQPELHLHPKAQATIGDLLIYAAVSARGKGHRFIVETHSEHLILRLLRRVRETHQLFEKNEFPITTDELAVIFVGRFGLPGYEKENQDRIDEGTVADTWLAYGQDVDEGKDWVKWTNIKLIPVTPQGEFEIDWPGGFFEERLDELLSADELKQWRFREG